MFDKRVGISIAAEAEFPKEFAGICESFLNEYYRNHLDILVTDFVTKEGFSNWPIVTQEMMRKTKLAHCLVRIANAAKQPEFDPDQASIVLQDLIELEGRLFKIYGIEFIINKRPASFRETKIGRMMDWAFI